MSTVCLLQSVFIILPGVEMQCIGHFKLLFSLLHLERCVAVQQSVLAVVEGVTGNADCVSDIAASEVRKDFATFTNMLCNFCVRSFCIPFISIIRNFSQMCLRTESYKCTFI